MDFAVVKTKLAPVAKKAVEGGRKVVAQFTSKPDTFERSAENVAEAAKKTGFFQKIGQRVTSGAQMLVEKIKTRNMDILAQAAKEAIEKGSESNRQFAPLLNRLVGKKLGLMESVKIEELIKHMNDKTREAFSKALLELSEQVQKVQMQAPIDRQLTVADNIVEVLKLI